MSTLQTLRNAQLLTRLVLVWFALFIGVAVASPLVKPQSAEMVCSAMGGMKMVMSDDGAGDAVNTSLHAALDCPACLPLIAPPQNLEPVALPPGGLSHVLQPRPAARLASLLGQPWQARAPPVISA
jgi:Protein of unknown function (DUF2946)